MKSIAIIGFGRFGELLADLSRDSFTVNIVESDSTKRDLAAGKNLTILEIQDLPTVDYIFLAVPISAIEALLKQIAPLVTNKQVVIDLCSVKTYPIRLMQQYLPHAHVLGSHPMFGPDSAKKGLAGMQVALCPVSVGDEDLKIIQGLWTKYGIVTAITTPEAHDRDTAYSQAFTYSLAKLILGVDIPDITFKTRSFNDIIEVATLSANDTDQLFHDMLFYNPYFTEMKEKLEKSMANTCAILDVIANEQMHSEQVLIRQ
ncbi:MAG: putative prephenate dehydrogenase [Candidatus Saccharibacteria bacterium]|jgi:prephenate dehydrogenase|nr:putative prephenate dehydrogenase [Candidatus Saccharibacteria bacterium]